jgi:hypothetical protein
VCVCVFMYGGWSMKEENIFTVDVRFIRSAVAYLKQYNFYNIKQTN